MNKILIVALILISIFVVYIKLSLSKLTYAFSLKEYKPIRINATEGGVINIVIDLVVFNPLIFNIPIQALYYEIYYKNHLLGRSADVSGFNLKSKDNTEFIQSVDVHIDKRTIDVARNYITKTPTEFTAKVYVKFLDMGINLKNIKFTY